MQFPFLMISFFAFGSTDTRKVCSSPRKNSFSPSINLFSGVRLAVSSNCCLCFNTQLSFLFSTSSACRVVACLGMRTVTFPLGCTLMPIVLRDDRTNVYSSVRGLPSAARYAIFFTISFPKVRVFMKGQGMIGLILFTWSVINSQTVQGYLDEISSWLYQFLLHGHAHQHRRVAGIELIEELFTVVVHRIHRQEHEVGYLGVGVAVHDVLQQFSFARGEPYLFRDRPVHQEIDLVAEERFVVVDRTNTQ